MHNETFLWHDYETTGADTRRDRPVQFAALRTTVDLEPIGDSITAWCRPQADVLPHPDAVLITGISPQKAEELGSSEREFAAIIHEHMSQPGTCSAGYNSLRFDDEITRHLLYRNFYDPYKREYDAGNSRWDLIDLARMAYALRPDGIKWPLREDGAASFRLEDLTAANQIEHAGAHDALVDVQATLSWARKLRDAQPKLFEYYLGLRSKQKVMSHLDFANQIPVVHISGMFTAQRGCTSIVLPIAAHPSQNNAVIVVDLMQDPSEWMSLSADEIADRLYTPTADLPEGVSRAGLKLIRANKCPALAPLSVLAGVDMRRIQLDQSLCLQHAEILKQQKNLASKLRKVFERQDDGVKLDADLALYSGGFTSSAQQKKFPIIRSANAEQIAQMDDFFGDARLDTLLFRYRARNFPESLSAEDSQEWQQFIQHKLLRDSGLASVTLAMCFERIAELRAEHSGAANKLVLLDALDTWLQARQLEISP